MLLGRFSLGFFVADALRIRTTQRTFTDCGDAIKANKKVKKTQPTSPATQFNCAANICNTQKSRQCNLNARFKTHTKRARRLVQITNCCRLIKQDKTREDKTEQDLTSPRTAANWMWQEQLLLILYLAPAAKFTLRVPFGLAWPSRRNPSSFVVTRSAFSRPTW